MYSKSSVPVTKNTLTYHTVRHHSPPPPAAPINGIPRPCTHPFPILRGLETTTKLVERCDIVYSMLSTPEAASDVFFDPEDGVLAGLSAGKSLVDCATLQVEVRACVRAWRVQVPPSHGLLSFKFLGFLGRLPPTDKQSEEGRDEGGGGDAHGARASERGKGGRGEKENL